MIVIPQIEPGAGVYGKSDGHQRQHVNRKAVTPSAQALALLSSIAADEPSSSSVPARAAFRS